MSDERRQMVRFLFLALDGAWRRLPAAEQVEHKDEFGRAVLGFRGRMLVRTYSLMGTRGDADLLFWSAAPDLETLQQFETALFSTRLGGYLRVAESYLSVTRKSDYEFPDQADADTQLRVTPADQRYLYVYPFVKTREWYALPAERRQEMMSEHVRIGRQYPGVRINTTYSFGLDDQEFVVTFENDDPGEFVDLVMELRGSAASAYTARDTPVFTCVQTSIWDALDALGGAAGAVASGRRDEAGFVRVAGVGDFDGAPARRVYLGTEAVAVFRVGERFFAVNDRCTHGRASLSEGTVDGDGVLTCPWHDGRFDVATGRPLSGPPRVPVRTYDVKVAGQDVLVRETPTAPVGAEGR